MLTHNKVGEGKNRSTLDKGEWRKGSGMRIEKTEKWTEHNFPMFTYEFITSVTPHHAQAQEWKVILHVCIICQTTFYCHI